MIANLIEQLNIYGTSIDKFRRMLKLMVVEFVYESRYLLIHSALGRNITDLIHKQGDKDALTKICNDLQRKLLKMPETDFKERKFSAEDIQRGIIPAMEDYVSRKRKWFKAAEVLIEMVTRAKDEHLMTTKERNTFRHQFILNYLN